MIHRRRSRPRNYAQSIQNLGIITSHGHDKLSLNISWKGNFVCRAMETVYYPGQELGTGDVSHLTNL